MACKRRNTLSSDPNYLLSLMSEIGDESDSDEEFDGWLGEDDGPVVTYYGSSDECEASSAQIEHRSHSLDLAVESPQSPTHSPMQLASRTSSLVQPEGAPPLFLQEPYSSTHNTA